MNMTHTTIDFNSRMICVIDGDDILEMNNSGQTQVIGKVNRWCNELVEVANEYKKLCIDNGLIEEEKTQEQLQQEQLELMQQMMTQMASMQKEIEVLRNGTNEYDSTRSEPIRNKSTGSKSSNKSSDAKSTECKDEK